MWSPRKRWTTLTDHVRCCLCKEREIDWCRPSGIFGCCRQCICMVASLLIKKHDHRCTHTSLRTPASVSVPRLRTHRVRDIVLHGMRGKGVTSRPEGPGCTSGTNSHSSAMRQARRWCTPIDKVFAHSEKVACVAILTFRHVKARIVVQNQVPGVTVTKESPCQFRRNSGPHLMCPGQLEHFLRKYFRYALCS
jgi:hypothetical protein